MYTTGMLNHEHRLTRMKDFEILFKEGRFVGANYVTAKIWRFEPTKYPKRDYKVTDLKIGFIVSKKISKRAVDRNRLKRQMREVVRLLLKDKKIQPGYMIAFSAKTGTVGIEYKEFEQDIISILKRARLLLWKNYL